MSNEKPSRRQQILEALAHELETSPGERITTASLARAVGVSEAALYRHFPSKAKMFEGLIEFLEDTVFGLVNRILAEEKDVVTRCEKIMGVLLGFSARNPGITRILVGDALVGETERLRVRVGQFYDRIETQFKQVLREGELAGRLPSGAPAAAMAGLLVAAAHGRMAQFVRSGFKRSPLELWEQQWPLLARGLF
ncbi:MAG: nucleoid occlusion factor SlmA [Gammaproteobacteria bacterium HGW-Gammaproteobacteria-1]|jgi:TetR/AcrR family transcriptional regulator|nr:MAG: nucleoid occlusion factor SlmA [Gammaproteobacteria bacterium HGW-Gammaproteobacteria-1]